MRQYSDKPTEGLILPKPPIERSTKRRAGQRDDDGRQAKEMLALTVLAFDRCGRADHLHAHRSSVRALAPSQLLLRHRKHAFVMTGEDAELLVYHVQLVENLQGRRRV